MGDFRLPTIEHKVEIKVTYKDKVMGSQCDLHDSDEILANTIRGIFYHLREEVFD